MVSDKKLQKELGSIEQEFAKDVSKLRKETLAIKQDYFKLKKEKGSLNAQALHQLEFSPGLQDRNTRSRRYGGFDPALLKAKDEEVSTPPKEDTRTFAEKRKDELLQKQLSSVPISEFENGEKIVDPYRRSLDRILGNSKLAKEAKLTAMKVKALDSMKLRTTNAGSTLSSNRRESTDPFSDSVYRRSRILSMPVTSTAPQKHLVARRSMSDSLYRSRKNSNMKNSSELPRVNKQERTRKRSNSMAPPKTPSLAPIDNNILRRRSDTPIFSGQLMLDPLNEQVSERGTSVSKLPDVVDNW